MMSNINIQKLMRELSSLSKSEITEEELLSLAYDMKAPAKRTPLQKSASFSKPALRSAESEFKDSMQERHRMSSSEYLQMLRKDKHALQTMRERMLLSRLCFYHPRSFTLVDSKKIMFIRTTAEGICGRPSDYDQDYYDKTAEILRNTKELNLSKDFEFTNVNATVQLIVKFIQVKLSNNPLLGSVKPEPYIEFLSLIEDHFRKRYVFGHVTRERNRKNGILKILKDISLENELFGDRARVIPIIKLISSSIRFMDLLNMSNAKSNISNCPIQDLVTSLQTKLYRLAAHLRSSSPEILDKCVINSKDIESLLLVSYRYLNNPDEVQDYTEILRKLARTRANLRDYVSMDL